MKKKIGIFDVRPKYIGHLILIVATLFAGYYVGDWLLNFQTGMTGLKMFIWFFLILYLSDNFWEEVLGV